MSRSTLTRPASLVRCPTSVPSRLTTACDSGRPCARCVRLGKQDTCKDAERKKRGRPLNANRRTQPLKPAVRTNKQTTSTPAKKPKLSNPSQIAGNSTNRPILPFIDPNDPNADDHWRSLVSSQSPTLNAKPEPPAILTPQDHAAMVNSEEMLQAIAAISMFMPLNENGAPDFSVLTKPFEEQTPEEREAHLLIQSQIQSQLAEQLHNHDPQFADEIKNIIKEYLPTCSASEEITQELPGLIAPSSSSSTPKTSAHAISPLIIPPPQDAESNDLDAIPSAELAATIEMYKKQTEALKNLGDGTATQEEIEYNLKQLSPEQIMMLESFMTFGQDVIPTGANANDLLGFECDQFHGDERDS